MNAAGLRIGLVGPLPPPSGGMANQTLQLAKLLREEGAAVELIQVNPPYRPSWTGKLLGIRALFRLLPYLAQLWRSAKHVDLYHVMANSGLSWHMFTAPAIWVARLRGKPVVVNYRGGEADNFMKKSRFWIKQSLDRTDAVIVPSGFLEAVFNRHGFHADVVPNVINLSRFSAGSIGPAPREKNDPCIVVTRNLEPIYDNANALRAFSIVKETFPASKLVIAGSGPEREALEALARELRVADAVTFTGRLDNEDMAALYRRADVMINPSLVDNMPNSLLEALASGVPVVSTNVGGVPYMVEHERTALLVPPHDSTAMATAVLTFLNDPAKAQRFKEAGIEAVQQYSWPRVRGQLLETYERVLAKRKDLMVVAK
jgi:glycosyltransferase involved in cell wall biosynthesis